MPKTGWRASRRFEAGAGAAVGLVASTLPVALASSPRPIGLLAPVINQVLVTVGATVAGFSHVSELRRSGGDPHGYGVWRAVGLGTAIASPVMGLCTLHSLPHPAFDPSLFGGCALSSAVIVASGMYLQTVLDAHPADATSAARARRAYWASGGLLAVSIVAQAAQLSVDTYRRVRGDGGMLPGHASGGYAAGAVTIGAGALMATLGAAAAARARDYGHEKARVAALTACVLGLVMAIAGASLLVPPHVANPTR